MGDAADTRTLGERLRAVAARLPFFGKDGYNDHHKYKYVSEARVKQAVRDALAAEGLLITDVRVDVLPGSTPTAAMVKVSLLVGDGVGFGPAARFEGVGGDQDKSGKAVMKATAAAIKYALTTAFLVPTGDDPEANKEADEIGRGNAAPKGRRRATKAAGTVGSGDPPDGPVPDETEDW